MSTQSIVRELPSGKLEFQKMVDIETMNLGIYISTGILSKKIDEILDISKQKHY